MSPWMLLLVCVMLLVVLPLLVVWLVVVVPKPVPLRWEVRLFLLVGMRTRDLLRLVVLHGVDPVFYHRALYALYVCLLQSLFYRPIEVAAYPPQAAIDAQVPILYPPVFILGHYRSGTSLLHELMYMCDAHRLCAPTSFMCFAPRVFLTRLPFVRKVFGSVSVTRPMDSMSVSLDSAFEDEFALANLTGLSPYLAAVFPRQHQYYQQYLTFKECDPTQVAKWKAAVLHFFKKVLLPHPHKRLLLKSPAHTARLSLLLSLFPHARFVHISRHPYAIYQSTHKLHERLLIQWCLQRPPLEDSNWRRGIILSHLSHMYSAYFKDSEALGPNQLVQVSYEDLIRQPFETIRGVYDKLGLPGWEEGVGQRVREYEDRRAKDKFEVNKHKPLSEEEREVVREAWAPYFKRFGYEG